MSHIRELERPAPLDIRADALFLDLDGTLAPIVSRPEDVRAEPRRNGLLRTLQDQLNGRLAVISGRSLGDIDRILDRAVLAAAGVHGLERRRGDGRVSQAQPSPALEPARAALAHLAAAWPGVRIEDKDLSLAVHYRAAPSAAEAVKAEAAKLAASGELSLQEGDMVAELLTPGPNKGDAVRTFMAEPPFLGARAVFIGDDLTDEAGFVAVRAMGGLGVLVGSDRPTAALARLDDVAAVLDWLGAGVSEKQA
jgi:trehalose 6-phosphate phosphatase